MARPPGSEADILGGAYGPKGRPTAGPDAPADRARPATPGRGTLGLNNIWIVEDHPAAAQALAAAARTAYADAAIAGDARIGDALQRLAGGYAPDLALIDLDLPDGSGVDVLEALRRQCPACSTVVATIYDDDAHLFPALRAGARGYLLKDEPAARMSEALRGILRGEPPLSPSIARRLLRVFEAPPASNDEQELSPRERETLILIAKGYHLPDVAQSLGVTRSTAATYIKTVYRKLAVTSRAEATLEASRRGLVGRL